MIRRSKLEDADAIYGLYVETAAVPGGLARCRDEITPTYIHTFLRRCIGDGLSLVAVDDGGRVVGEVHASRCGLKVFGHVLTDLTISVHPACQSHGWGRQLFERFIEVVTEEMPEIRRIELSARESNTRAIRFYESLGFVAEGRLRGRVYGVGGRYEDDIQMGWLRSPASES
ncbi:GNAT family N-acetyltransferase [Methanofollis aquaemaris]|uniref:GNAT family N-acetyltransferase n=1 Tax=Methanofollis aquaemaris TaxID=126734 RepID=UPI00223EA811|nr:GNAT family N-acetyltransferase [Methanofollis aquaemaris]